MTTPDGYFPVPPPPAQQNPTPLYRTKRRPRWITPAAIAGALLVGVGIGAVSHPAPPAAAPVVKTETKTVTQYRTPASCITALSQADQIIGYSVDSMTIFSDTLTAVSNFDTAAIYAQAPKLNNLTSQIKAITDPYKSAKADCRAGQ